jgi:anti-sigma factor RsiW
MNVTRQVINDLWPVYAAGEASADTRALVEAFLRQDPAFARALQEQSAEPIPEQEIPRMPLDLEAKALRRTQRLLLGFDWTIFFAIMFSCFAFGRIVADTSWDVSPVNFIVTASIAVVFWVAFFVRLVWVRRQVLRSRIGDGAART